MTDDLLSSYTYQVSNSLLCHTNTLARASAPALAIYGLEGWNATSWMDSSNFFLWAVISCTQVLLSKFQSLIEQSWPEGENKCHFKWSLYNYCIVCTNFHYLVTREFFFLQTTTHMLVLPVIITVRHSYSKHPHHLHQKDFHSPQK